MLFGPNNPITHPTDEQTATLQRLQRKLEGEANRARVSDAGIWAITLQQVPDPYRAFAGTIERLFGVRIRFVHAQGLAQEIAFNGANRDLTESLQTRKFLMQVFGSSPDKRCLAFILDSPEETARADPLMHDRIPCISRRSEIVGDKVDVAVPERALRIPWDGKGQFIAVLYDPRAKRLHQTLQQCLRGLFHRRAV